MKKVLLASTALVAMSGAAAFAEVSLSGSAEMGLFGTMGQVDRTDATGDTTRLDADQPLQFWHDLNVTFTLSGETDGGLAFGAEIDLDDADDLGTETAEQNMSVFISGDFGTVTIGDTDGALDRVLTDAGNIGNPGSLNDSETIHLGYVGSYLDGSGDGQIVRYDYTFEGFQFAASVEQHGYDRDADGNITGKNGDGVVANDDDDITWAVGFGYEFEFAGGSVDTGIGYQYSDNGEVEFDFDDAGLGSESLTFGGLVDPDGDGILQTTEVAATGLGATVSLDNGISAGFTYTLYDVDGEDKNLHHTAVGAGYSFDAFSVHANYGTWAVPTGARIDGFGVSAGYDLGGGASLLAGYGRSNADDIVIGGNTYNDLQIDTYSFGLSFSF